MIKNNTSSIISLALCLFAVGCSNTTQTSQEENQGINDAFRKELKTIPAVIANQRTEMTLTGKVISDPDRTAYYAPLVSGVVERAHFSLGDKVRKGQYIMDIRSTELSSLEAELTALESELAIAKRELTTIRSMYNDGLMSERELLEAESSVKQTEAALAKNKADISVHGKSKGNGTFSISSPIDGYVINKTISTGSTFAAEGEPVFAIADLTSVWIIANVYASNLQFVKEGMEVSITTLSYPDKKFPGKISALSQVFDPEDKALKARIVMNNPDLALKPEMSVVITLKEEVDSQLIAVPSEALIFDNDRHFVVVEEQPGNYQMRQVVIAGHNNELTYLASGLKEGENIVVKNHLLVYAELKGV